MTTTKYLRLLIPLAGAAVALAALTACGNETKTAEDTQTRAETPAPTATMPQAATFVADMPAQDGQPPMAMAVTVDGENVVAYGCNGVDDAAWFFGTQKNGTMELSNRYLDTMTARFEDGKLTGSMTMNEPDAKPVSFTANQAPEPAGIYTATMGDARMAWVVMPDGRMVGVNQPNSKNDREVIDQINEQQADFKEKVRQARVNRQFQQAGQFNMGTMSMDMPGTAVRVVKVTGNMKSPPMS